MGIFQRLFRRQPFVFVSYRRSETQYVAGRLRDSLERRLGDGSVFMDVEDIAAGANFIDSITTALSGCASLLVVIGKDWSESGPGVSRLQNPDDVLRLEIETALRLGVLVIPVLVDDAQMPKASQLPRSLQAFSTRQARRVDAERWRTSVNEIVKAIRIADQRSAGAIPLRARAALALVLAVEMVAGLAGLRTIEASATPGLDIPLTTATTAPINVAGVAGHAKEAAKVAGKTACVNDYLGYSVQVPPGMASSGDDDPFVTCEAFAYGKLDAKHYKDEDLFSVPVVFVSSQLAPQYIKDLATSGYDEIARQDLMVGSRSATLIETSEHPREFDNRPLYWRDIVIVPQGPATLVGELRLPQSVGRRAWRSAKTLFESLARSLNFDRPHTACNRSEAWHCGDFYWTQKPIDSPLTIETAPSNQMQAVVGSEVTVRVHATDLDANTIELTVVDWGDVGRRSVLARTGGDGIDDIVRTHRQDGVPYGPWPPPQPRKGDEEYVCTHVYKQVGTFKASFGARSSATGDDVPKGRDPYEGYESKGLTVVVAQDPTATTDTTIPEDSSTTSSTSSTSSTSTTSTTVAWSNAKDSCTSA